MQQETPFALPPLGEGRVGATPFASPSPRGGQGGGHSPLPSGRDGVGAILDEAAARINVPSFVDDDPVQFPRRYNDLRDIEIVSLLVSHISWGRRPMILRDAERMLALMDGQPYRWLIEEAYEQVPDTQNIHRTFFGGSMKHLCRGLRLIYSCHDTLDALCAALPASEHPAWTLAASINAATDEANAHRQDKYCLPQDLEKTALKRLNMALRWLVRDDGIVDMGVWRSLRPSQLYIPLDVHVGNTSRDLGLITRKQNDRRTVLELTSALRRLRPHDPIYYDFALFGLGIEKTT